MPHLNEKMYPQHRLIADIKEGNSFVKVVPEEIGEVIYFDTTEPTAEPLGDNVYARRKIISVLATILAVTAIWVLLSSHPGWAIALTVAAVFVGVVSYSVQRFAGFDYFVGTKGYALYHFSGTRTNIDNKTVRKYDDAFAIIHKEVMNYKNGFYQNTDYEYILVGPPDESGVVSKIDSSKGIHYKKNEGSQSNNPEYDLWCRIESVYNTHYLRWAESLLDEGKMVPIFLVFPKDDDRWDTSSSLLIGPNTIQCGKTVYNKGDLKRVYIEKGVLYLEDSEFEKNIFGSVKSGKQITIPLDQIANRNAVITLLSSLYGLN